MQDRINMLEYLSGLTVIFHERRTNKHDNRFTFMYGKRAVKDVFTYGKAKAFAQGMQSGRAITLMEWESVQ